MSAKKQRVKGNVKPSSSTRSAEILHGAGLTSQGFIGFGTFEGDLGYVPSPGTDDFVNNSLHADFRLVLRKLSKRDYTTKFKALQELIDLCKEKTAEEVIAILPYWPRLYNKCCMENDRKVREASSLALHAIITVAKKELATQLKALMPMWLGAQYDTYAPAASAAKTAFNEAFPVEKQNDALLYCSKEIATNIAEVVATLPSKKPSSSKSDDDVERVEQESRQLHGALQCFNRLLLVNKGIEDCTAQNEAKSPKKRLKEDVVMALLTDRFWKLLSHEDPQVRSAFLTSCSSLIRHLPSATNDHKSTLCKKLLPSALKENSPICQYAAWEYIITCIDNIADWSSLASIDKALLPGLQSSLCEGFSGNAKFCGPHLLVLVSKLPFETHSKIYSGLRNGLSNDRVCKSQSEVAALMQAFCDVTLYYLTTVTEREVRYKIIDNELLPFMKDCVQEARLAPSAVVFFKGLRTILNCDVMQNNSDLSDHCMENIKILVCEESACNLSKKSELLEQLIQGHTPTFKLKVKRIAFIDSATETEEEKQNSMTDKSILTADHRYKEIMETFLKLLVSQFESAQEAPLCLSTLLSFYSNEDILCRICDVTVEEENIALYYFKNVLKSAKLVPLQQKAALVDSLYRVSSKKEDFLCQVLETMNIGEVTLVLKSLDSNVEAYFTSDVFATKLLHEVKLLTASYLTSDVTLDKESAWELLVLSLQTNNGKPRIGESATKKVMQQICDALLNYSIEKQKDGGDVNKCATFVCRLLRTFIHIELWNNQNCVVLSQVETLVLEIVRFSFLEELPFTDDVLVLMKNTWLEALARICASNGAFSGEKTLLSKIGTFLRESALTATSLTRIERLADAGRCAAAAAAASLFPDSEEDRSSVTTDTLREFCPPFASGWVSHTGRFESQLLDAFVMRGLFMGRETEQLTEACSSTALPAETCYASFVLSLFSPEEMRSDVQQSNLKHCLVVMAWFDVCLDKTSQVNELEEFTRKKLELALETKDAGAVNALLTSYLESSLTTGGIHACALTSLCRLLSDDLQLSLTMLDFKDRFASADWCFVDTLCVVSQHIAPSDALDAVLLLTSCLANRPHDEILTIPGCITDANMLTALISLIGNKDSGKKLMNCDILVELLSVIQSIRNETATFAFDCHIQQLSHTQISWNRILMRLFSALLANFHGQFQSEQLDFVLCSAVAWMQTYVTSLVAGDRTAGLELFLIDACDLVATAAEILDFQSTVDLVKPEVKVEWAEFYSPMMFEKLYPTAVARFGVVNSNELSLLETKSLLSLCHALSWCTCLSKLDLPVRLAADEVLPDDVQIVLENLAPLLRHRIRAVQLSTFTVLNRYLSNRTESLELESSEGGVREPPMALMNVLRSCAAINSDQSATGTRTYLLTWRLILTFIRKVNSERRVEYAAYLRNSGDVLAMLDVLLSMMPPVTSEKWFRSSPRLDASIVVSKEAENEELSQLACHVFMKCLEILPVLTRVWWSGLSKQQAQEADRFTAANVSPVLVEREMKKIQLQNLNFDNMTIKTRPVSREVVAVYAVDESSIELVVKLPANHPLQPMTVECGRRIGVEQGQWRKWMLQMTMFLQHQNGSILDALSTWKKNVDKKFEGVEECMICFSVIHGTNMSLPKLQCRTCKKKFHPACLYKWFSTSNNSTCPLCRNLF